MHPYVISEIGSARRRQMLLQSDQQRVARRVIRLARVTRRAARAERRMHRSAGTAVRLRSELES